jgi:hypothetical protein
MVTHLELPMERETWSLKRDTPLDLWKELDTVCNLK